MLQRYASAQRPEALGQMAGEELHSPLAMQSLEASMAQPLSSMPFLPGREVNEQGRWFGGEWDSDFGASVQRLRVNGLVQIVLMGAGNEILGNALVRAVYKYEETDMGM